MGDAIDIEPVRAALASLGLTSPGQLPAPDRARLVALLAKAEAGSTGRLRGHRHTMLDDSDISATRHARGFVAGALVALNDVSIKVPAGSFHALLGENGAGKSTLVKCIMGFYIPDKGALKLDGQEVAVRNPRDAQALGIGMVYQHFTLVPSLTAAENLVASRADAPAIINWRKERRELESFPGRMPFLLPPDPPR